MTSFSLSHGVFVIERWCNSSLSLLTVKLIIKNALGINPSWLNQHDTCLFISNTHNPFIQNTLPQCCAAPRVKKMTGGGKMCLCFCVLCLFCHYESRDIFILLAFTLHLQTFRLSSHTLERARWSCSPFPSVTWAAPLKQLEAKCFTQGLNVTAAVVGQCTGQSKKKECT